MKQATRDQLKADNALLDTLLTRAQIAYNALHSGERAATGTAGKMRDGKYTVRLFRPNAMDDGFFAVTFEMTNNGSPQTSFYGRHEIDWIYRTGDEALKLALDRCNRDLSTKGV